MVAAQEGKLNSVRAKSDFKKATRRLSGGIRHNIPFNKAAVVKRIEVVRKVKNRVLTKSTKVVVPSVPSKPSDSSLPSPPDHDVPSIPPRQTRKGPSRSAAVRFPPPTFLPKN